MSGIIDIADYLHVPVVAEGVETEEQYMVLKAMGCEYVQGYYFSKPVPHKDFDHFIVERAKMKVEVAPVVRKHRAGNGHHKRHRGNDERRHHR